MWDLAGAGDGQLRAGWVRQRYVIAGERLCPAPQSEMEPYDPMEYFYPRGQGPKDARSWYLDLVDLDLDDPRAIEDVVSRWGLLGLFQHDLVQSRHVWGFKDGWEKRWAVGIAPEISEVYEWPEVDQLAGSRIENVSMIEQPGQFFGSKIPLDARKKISLALAEVWINEGIAKWGEESGTLIVFDIKRAWEHIRPHAEQEAANRFKAWLDRQQFGLWGSVIIRSQGGGLVEVPLAEYYEKFFPDLEFGNERRKAMLASVNAAMGDASGPSASKWGHALFLIEVGSKYPRLRSNYLWDTLCEPLTEFRSAVELFKETRQLCESVRDAINTGDNENARKLGWKLRQRFARQLCRVDPVPNWSEEVPREWALGWSYPSLLSIAYVCLYLDFATQNRIIRFCANETCNRSFVADRADKRFCQFSCKNAQSQRERRRRPADPEGQDEG